MTEEIEVAEDRHLIRSLIKLAVFVGLLVVVGRFLAQKRDEFAGLSESEARAKFVDKMGPKLGDDTAEEIADQVIPKLKERGLLKSDATDAAADAAEDLAEEAADKAKDVADKAEDAVSEAVDSVVKD